MVAGIVLAAGPSRRFGAPKQLAPFAGRPLLEHALAAMARSAVERPLVVLGARAAEIVAAVDLHGVEPLLCADWEEGQAASLRAGIAAAAEAEAVVVALGDQPLIGPAAIDRLLERRGEEAALRATYGGVPGHPVLLERALFGAVSELRGDTGARAVLETVPCRGVPCDGLGAPTDVDTPERLLELERATITRPRSNV